MTYTLDDFILPEQPTNKEVKQELYEILKLIHVERKGKTCIESYCLAANKVLDWYPIPF